MGSGDKEERGVEERMTVQDRRGKDIRKDRMEGEERRGKVRGEEGTYRFLLVGLGGLDLLVEAVDLVLEVLHVLLVFFLLL